MLVMIVSYIVWNVGLNDRRDWLIEEWLLNNINYISMLSLICVILLGDKSFPNGTNTTISSEAFTIQRERQKTHTQTDKYVES